MLLCQMKYGDMESGDLNKTLLVRPW